MRQGHLMYIVLAGTALALSAYERVCSVLEGSGGQADLRAEAERQVARLRRR